MLSKIKIKTLKGFNLPFKIPKYTLKWTNNLINSLDYSIERLKVTGKVLTYIYVIYFMVTHGLDLRLFKRLIKGLRRSKKMEISKDLPFDIRIKENEKPSISIPSWLKYIIPVYKIYSKVSSKKNNDEDVDEKLIDSILKELEDIDKEKK